ADYQLSRNRVAAQHQRHGATVCIGGKSGVEHARRVRETGIDSRHADLLISHGYGQVYPSYLASLGARAKPGGRLARAPRAGSVTFVDTMLRHVRYGPA